MLVRSAVSLTGTDALLTRIASRVILFGPRTDLEAHAAARAAGLGPMWARSKVIAGLPSLLREDSVLVWCI
jgi:hypothetical protein